MDEERPETILHQSPRLDGAGLPGDLLARMLGALRRQSGAAAVCLWVRSGENTNLHLFASEPSDLPLGEVLPAEAGPVRETFSSGTIQVVRAPSAESGFDHPPLILDRLRPKAVVLLPVGSWGDDGAARGVAALYLLAEPSTGHASLFDWSRWAGLLDAFLPGDVEPREGGEPVLGARPTGDDALTLESLQQVSAGLARRMREQLAGILPALQRSEQLIEEDAPARRFLRYVSEGLDRVSDLLQRLVTFGGEGPLVAEMVRMPDLVSEAIRRLEAERPGGVRLKAELPEGLPLLLADRVQVVAAISEVVKNALEVSVAGTEVIVSLHERDEGIEVRVKDEGPGMTAHVLKRATRPFYSTKRPDTHPGLGLSAAQGILHRHGGELALSSRPGAGSTVRMWFPLEARLPAGGAPRGE